MAHQIGKKFKYKPFQNLLLENYLKTGKEQKNILNSAFESWKKNLEQVDDVTIIGVRV